MKKWDNYLCVGVLAVGLLLTPRTHALPQDLISEQNPSKTVVSVFPSILFKIADCESGERDKYNRAIPGSARQFEADGSVVKNLNKNGTTDYGYLQINSIHLEEARRMGMDIMTLEGNKKFGEWLYDHQGTTPWNWSRNCWK